MEKENIWSAEEKEKGGNVCSTEQKKKEENIWSREQKKNRKRKGGKYLVHGGEEEQRGKINGGVDNRPTNDQVN